jgi:hypothetical protein
MKECGFRKFSHAREIGRDSQVISQVENRQSKVFQVISSIKTAGDITFCDLPCVECKSKRDIRRSPGYMCKSGDKEVEEQT